MDVLSSDLIREICTYCKIIDIHNLSLCSHAYTHCMEHIDDDDKVWFSSIPNEIVYIIPFEINTNKERYMYYIYTHFIKTKSKKQFLRTWLPHYHHKLQQQRKEMKRHLLIQTILDMIADNKTYTKVTIHYQHILSTLNDDFICTGFKDMLCKKAIVFDESELWKCAHESEIRKILQSSDKTNALSICENKLIKIQFSKNYSLSF